MKKLLLLTILFNLSFTVIANEDESMGEETTTTISTDSEDTMDTSFDTESDSEE